MLLNVYSAYFKPFVAGARVLRRRLAMAEALCRASCVRCCVLKDFLDLIIKL